MAVESVAGSPWNRWSDAYGMGGQMTVESAGYPGVKVNTHAFRHELNTRMHQAGLSQLLIDAFSGRTTMGSVTIAAQ